MIRFYERQGGLLALLYVLRATDCHYENVIACGEHPVIVDHEALFQPGVDAIARSEIGVDGWSELWNSVLSVGLLPHRSWITGGTRGVDVSGLGAPQHQKLPFEVGVWTGADRVTWLGLNHAGRDVWTIHPVGPELYDGSSGIAIFLAYLGAVMREARYTAQARRIAVELVDEGTHARYGSRIGAFSGLSGVSYALLHLSSL